jgi:hypothetical protein
MRTVSILAPQKLAPAENGGRGITHLGLYQGPAKFTLAAKSDAGTTPTLAVKIQNAPEQLRTPSAPGIGTSAIGSRTDTDTAIRIGASFSLASAITIAANFIPLIKTGTPTGTLTLAIQADDDGEPSGTDLATATFAAEDVSPAGTNCEFRFANPIDLAAGDYWLVLTSDVTISSTNFILWRSVDVDGTGNAAIFNTAWADDADENLEFWSESYTFADVPGLTFESVTTTGTLATLEANADTLAYIRPHITVGGTDSPAYYASVAALAKLQAPA